VKPGLAQQAGALLRRVVTIAWRQWPWLNTWTTRIASPSHRSGVKSLRTFIGAGFFGIDASHNFSCTVLEGNAAIDGVYSRVSTRSGSTHTHTFNGPLSGTTRVSRYQKGKTSLDFTEARDGEWQWHPLGHMRVCTSLQTDNHASIGHHHRTETEQVGTSGDRERCIY